MSHIYDKFLASTGVSTDTRTLEDGNIFFALKGDNFNGNTHAAAAIEKGASFAVVDEAHFAKTDRYILVADVLKALQDLAAEHRANLKIPVIGLTGSNGKTTSKELLAKVLSKKYNVAATVGNFNNHIGVPLTLLKIKPEHELAIIEMGANHQSEIAMLCNIAQPTHGFINNIGKAHLEGFGGEEGIKKGKGELYDYLTATGGTAFVNSLDPILVDMASTRTFKQKVSYGSTSDSLHFDLINESPVVVFGDGVTHYTSSLPGKYNFYNMLNAMAIGAYFGIEKADYIAAVCTYQPTNARSQFMAKGTNKILLDAYNANPSSMEAAIRLFASLSEKSKVVILGDMLELGPEAAAEHLKLGKLIAQFDFEKVILFGPLMESALVALPRALYFTDKFSLHHYLNDSHIENAAILIKGSRGVKLESTLDFI